MSNGLALFPAGAGQQGLFYRLKRGFIFALILASSDKQPVTVGALAFVTASGIQYGQIAASIVLSVTPTLLLALYAQRYLVEGLSMGAVKG